jgi:hypothetical protein
MGFGRSIDINYLLKVMKDAEAKIISSYRSWG